MWQLTISFGIFLFILPFSYARFGILSAQFLILVHLFLAVPIRTLLSSASTSTAAFTLPVLYFDPEQYTSTLALSISSAIFILLATLLTKSTQDWATTNNLSDLRFNRLSSTSISIFAFLVLVLYLSLLTLLFGGLTSAFASFLSRTVDAMQGLSYVHVFADIFFASSLTIFYLWKHKGVGSAKVPALIFVPLSVILLTATGGRGNLIQALISFLIISSNGKRYLDRNTGLKLGALLLGAALIIPIGLAARKSAQTGNELSSMLSEVYADIGPAVSAPFALIDHFELSKQYADTHGFDFGWQFLAFAAKPIPRAFWPEKPQPIAIAIREEFYNDTLGGIPPGLAGELYISFGWASILLLPLALISIINLLRGIRLLKVFRPHIPLVNGLLVPYIAFNLVRGGFDIGGMRIIIMLASLYLAISVASSKKSI
ncbi:MAG: oligosaccharide repeat unit polymerase [Thiobacillus sp.]|nr:oligosaccharide repeat unit polymerase [Thiobacillus sp.]